MPPKPFIDYDAYKAWKQKVVMKDWTGNKKSTFGTLGASSHSIWDRQENDYYATSPKAIDDLFSFEKFSTDILEPSCGEGHLSKRMIELGKNVVSYDLINRGYGTQQDFLKSDYKWSGDIITNPPYRFAQEFIEKSLNIIPTGNKVAMFLKIQFLEGKKRYKFFTTNPPKIIYVYSGRIACSMNGDFSKPISSALCFCWYIWEKGFKGDPIIKWIN